MSISAHPRVGDPGLLELLRQWEEILTLIVDPNAGKVADRKQRKQLLSMLLDRAGIAEQSFWGMSPSQRGRIFLGRYSRASRSLPQLEISSFDLDRVSKERFRSEPLTLGAAWHYGYWRSYFSHAAITHPANDGLREEFSTAWDILRRQPAIIRHHDSGSEVSEIQSIHLDLPMLVGPLPHSDGVTMERAYLEAIKQSNHERDLRVTTRVIIDSCTYREQIEVYRHEHQRLLVRIPATELLTPAGDAWPLVRDLAEDSRCVEIEVPEDLEVVRLQEVLEQLHAQHSELLVAVYLRHGDSFWEQLYAAVHSQNVCMLHVHSGLEKSYRLIPAIDALLKKARLRSRVQLVTAGGDTDAISSASVVYEAILLGANGGSATHVAELALSTDFAEVANGANPQPVLRDLAGRPPEELAEQALSTLTCWQHSILDFLSCMGIDDVQKTSGNSMAITMTEDWFREVDALATGEFGSQNKEVNLRRTHAEPIPASVRRRFRASRLLKEIETDLPLVAAAKILAQRNVNYHLMNTNQNLTAEHLNVIYRMAAGRFPEVEDFFLEGTMGPFSIDGIHVKLSQASVKASLAALRRDSTALDYINLCVPRGFNREGAVEPGAQCVLAADSEGQRVLETFEADTRGGFNVHLTHPGGEGSLYVIQATPPGEKVSPIELVPVAAAVAANGSGLQPAPGAPPGVSVRKASADHRVLLKADAAGTGFVLEGIGIREPVFTGPVNHASISLGAAGEDFLFARVEGNAGHSLTSSGEGGPLRLPSEVMRWESLQAASGHFGITPADVRAVNDVEIKINQGAKPGKGGRLAGPKVTATVSKARNIPVGTDALSPDPKHDIYSIEDMPAEVWLWLQYDVHCGIKITGSTYTKYVAAGMWSNFVVDYLLVDAGLGGSGNYHADSSRVGWPDVLRTVLHTHHALLNEPLYDAETQKTWPIRDLNGSAFGAAGGTKLLASGGIRSEMDMLKVLIAGADGLLEASIGKAVAFGCNQCGNCHLDCPRGGITTKIELTMQNDRATMSKRFRNWSALNMVKLAVLIDALNRELGYVDRLGMITNDREVLDDIRKLRGRTDLLVMPSHADATPPVRCPSIEALDAAIGRHPVDSEATATGEEPALSLAEDAEGHAEAHLSKPPEPEHDSCRVGSLLVNDPVDVAAVWEAARLSMNGGNNRGGGIAFGGFTPEPLRKKTCLIFNTIGPDRAATMERMLEHLSGLDVFDAQGSEMELDEIRLRLPEFRVPVRARYADQDGWRKAGLLEDVGDITMLFTAIRGDTLWRYGRRLVKSPRWLQRRVKYGHLKDHDLLDAIDRAVRREDLFEDPNEPPLLLAFLRDVKEEYYMMLAHVIDTRYYRTGGPAPKYAARRSGYLVSMGEDMGSIKISGWTHLIPEYFDFDNFWTGYPGVRESGGVRRIVKREETWTTKLMAHVWGMHHRYPTNSPAMDAEGRGNPAGAHPFKAYNVLLMHNGEQVGVDATAPMLTEHGFVHIDSSIGEGVEAYAGDSLYERKALTDTEYAAYLVDFTRRVLGLPTDEATQIISPVTGIDLEAVEPAERRERYRQLTKNYVHLTPTGPYKFTILETRHSDAGMSVGFRENMDIKFLRPHEIAINWDSTPGGICAVANGSEAKIADCMLGVLRQQSVLADAGADLRFNMRPGGRPQSGEMGGVFESFLDPVSRGVSLQNRFGERVGVQRAGSKPIPTRDLVAAISGGRKRSREEALQRLQQLQKSDVGSKQLQEEFTTWTLDRIRDWSFDEYRFVVESLLPSFAESSEGHRETALRILTEVRKRVHLCDAGGKSLAALQYYADGGFDSSGKPEGGIYRLLAAVPSIWETKAATPFSQIRFGTRLDLATPASPSQRLVVDMHGFHSEAFGIEGAARFLSQAVKLGWRNIIMYNFRGGPRYLGTNLTDAAGQSAQNVRIDLYGRQIGDFLGALLEGAEIHCYGQGQSHVGMKSDRGSVFVLQDILNTGLYAAHGGTLSVWDSGSRFAVAGQNRVFLEDGLTLAAGLKSIHFGSPNEYAFEYLMSGGDNSLHVVMGLEKPDALGQLHPRPRPYAGKFFMSGAAAGRVFVFDPNQRMDPAQVHGNEARAVESEEWDQEVGVFIAEHARRRGLPIEVVPGGMRIRLGDEWREYGCDEVFTKYVPIRIPKKVQRMGVAPPALVGMGPE